MAEGYYLEVVMMIKKIIAVIASIFMITSASPMNAEVIDTEMTTAYFQKTDEYVANPFMGGLGHGWLMDPVEDISLQIGRVTWAELESDKGVYDFETYEAYINYDYWTEDRGMHFVMLFNMDYPDESLERDIPDWLYQTLLIEAEQSYRNLRDQSSSTQDYNNYNDDLQKIKNAETLYQEFLQDASMYKLNIPGVGTYYRQSTTTEQGVEVRGGFSPNYSSEAVIEGHRRLMNVYGERYDNPDKVFVIWMGSVGHWGEMHTWYTREAGDVGIYPQEEVANQYYQAYADNFDDVFVSSRMPRQVAVDYGFALHNHALGSEEDTYDYFLDYLAEGYRDYVSGTEYPAYPDYWKVGPHGTEFLYTGDLRYLEDEYIESTLQQLEDTHVTYHVTYIDLEGEKDINRKAMLAKMGYRFGLSSVSYSQAINVGEEVSIVATWANDGVAPFYYPWQIEAELRDVSGNLVGSVILDNDISDIMPGSQVTYESSITLTEPYEPGIFSLYTSIINPETGKASIMPINVEADQDGYLYVGEVMINEATELYQPSNDGTDLVEATEKSETFVDGVLSKLKKLSTYAEQYLTQLMAIDKKPSSVVVLGSRQGTIYKEVTYLDYDVLVKNKNSKALDKSVLWSVSGEGLTIDQTGRLYISNETEPQDVIISVMVQEDSKITYDFVLSLGME